MKVLNKKLFLLCIGIFLMLVVSIITIPSTITKADAQKTILKHPANSGPIDENPKPRYVANKNTPKELLMSEDAILKQADKIQAKTKESYIKSAKLKTYKNHMLEDEPNNDDVNYQVDPDRMVWVVVTEFPDGLETKAGFYAKATLTVVYDAETGEYLESRVHGNRQITK